MSVLEVVRARVGLERPDKTKTIYFVFEINDRVKNYSSWNRILHKKLNGMKLESAGSLTDRIMVVKAQIAIWPAEGEDDQRERFEQSIDAVRDYLVSTGYVKEGLAISDRTYYFGALIKDVIKERLRKIEDPDSTFPRFNSIPDYYDWNRARYRKWRDVHADRS